MILSIPSKQAKAEVRRVLLAERKTKRCALIQGRLDALF
jgi:hypothetical protein